MKFLFDLRPCGFEEATCRAFGVQVDWSCCEIGDVVGEHEVSVERLGVFLREEEWLGRHAILVDMG